MRRRVLLALLATVAISLVLAGVGTYLLLVRQADRSTESGLRDEAEALANLLALSREDAPGAIREKRVVRGLRLEGISLVALTPRGRIRGQLPEGVTAEQLDTDALLAGATLSGRDDGLVWAAAPAAGVRGAAAVAVLTKEPERPRAPVGWFLIAGGIAMAIGSAIAAVVSDNLTRPLREAQAATVRIASGDLSTPIPDPPPSAGDEVATLTRSMNAMAGALARSRGLERQFLLSVSHDLRTPLTSIRGYADAIADGVGGDPAAAARVIATESRRLDRLVQDLLDLARLDAREFRFEPRPVDLREVVRETAEGFRPTADGAGIALHVSEAAAPVPAVVDPDRVAQVVANLLENGLKFAGTAVWVEVRDVDGAAVVSVVDDGPGIAAVDVPHVFDRLYVTDRRPSRQVGGTGLGLAIVHQLVVGMGGQAWVESPALPSGTGARVSVRFRLGSAA